MLTTARRGNEDLDARVLLHDTGAAPLHFTAASAGMPWIALACKSVMMYLVTISAALRLGGPALPASLPNGGMSRNGRSYRIGVPHFVLLPHRTGKRAMKEGADFRLSRVDRR